MQSGRWARWASVLISARVSLVSLPHTLNVRPSSAPRAASTRRARPRKASISENRLAIVGSLMGSVLLAQRERSGLTLLKGRPAPVRLSLVTVRRRHGRGMGRMTYPALDE